MRLGIVVSQECVHVGRPIHRQPSIPVGEGSVDDDAAAVMTPPCRDGRDLCEEYRFEEPRFVHQARRRHASVSPTSALKYSTVSALTTPPAWDTNSSLILPATFATRPRGRKYPARARPFGLLRLKCFFVFSYGAVRCSANFGLWFSDIRRGPYGFPVREIRRCGRARYIYSAPHSK